MVAALGGLVIGVFIGRYLLKKVFSGYEAEAKAKAESIIRDADGIVQKAQETGDRVRKERIADSKEKIRKLQAEFDAETAKKKGQLKEAEQNLQQAEQNIKQGEQRAKQLEANLNKATDKMHRKAKELDEERETLSLQTDTVKKKQAELDNARQEQVAQLEKISDLTADQARGQLIEALKVEADGKAAILVKDILDEAKLTATKEAKKVVIQTIQRTATEHAVENCVSIFNIESDDIKGKIIGREGRNIRALEAVTGVEIIVDDTPEAIIISGFDPVRREVARLSLHRLVTDGRIHPARIEEVVAKTQKNIEEEIIELGERTVIDLGVNGLHPELIKLVGRMRFRSSYGQNLLQHSREVANLCATMASELGLNAKLARRAGLLHDIGKVWPEEPELPHALLGMELAKKYKEHPEVCNAIGAHHDEVEMTSILSPIIQVCDAISGSRPGARREMMESYIKRLQDLEALATGFDGVTKCYAIQAGRELRVIVDAENVSDDRAGVLSYDISSKIEKEMQYPGQIKVTVIREMRSVHYAK